ncbi:HAD family hydrolase [Jatrophihabitans sp.]|uniref:HAD family hydrolase n=1 Tax=Jatrophihabitans sp. TaxID=1932789 RepID=UPI002B9C7643|nr:HAD family hydrolase [Jatrophihabitans sp.]
MTVLIASDLDRTLVYSRAALALSGAALPELTCVERRGGEPVSFLTATAARLLARLAGRAVLVPVTTRTPEQLARVELPGPPPRFAVAANGGVLLEAGMPDPDWQRRVAATVAGSAPLSDITSYVRQHCRPAWTRHVREAAGLFCYAVLEEGGAPDGFVAEATEWAARRGWTVTAQGRKLYWTPDGLTKAAAVGEVADRTGAELVLAAGDSVLDRELVRTAHRGIVPAHGELAGSGWSAPGVECTAATGVLAGEEIAAWFVARVAEFGRWAAPPASAIS